MATETTPDTEIDTDDELTLFVIRYEGVPGRPTHHRIDFSRFEDETNES